MRKFVFGVVFFLISGIANFALAQQTVWIQIEAQRSLGKAQDVARNYSGSLQQVNGFALRSGWYAIAIGPFSPVDADDVLQQLRVTRQIPVDSYIVDGTNFRRQFWPVGAATLNTQPATPEVSEQVEEQVEVQIIATPVIGEETIAQARQSENQLLREERELLQTALQWEGFYRSAIDGAIGPGTRKSMAGWQEQEGYEATGVLTTLQRRTLVMRYQDMLASLGMTNLIDNATGIEITLPLTMVEFDRYEPPFAHFVPKNGSDVQVLLISQTGDEATLRGLFDIMQTLEIVPLEGARNISARSFTLTGENRDMSSYTFAALANGHVKGFTLIWPASADKRRSMVLNSMKNSFAALPDTVLPDVFGDPDAAQSLDLMAGLSVRQPDVSRSGFYIDALGSVLTTAQAVASCERITLDEEYNVEVAAIDQSSGLALLRPIGPLSPIRIAQLNVGAPRLNSEIAVSGYSYEGLLGAPSLTYGILSDLRGLKGETSINRLSVEATPGDAGGPVFDSSGGVLGMLLPTEIGGRRLPDDVRFAVNSDSISVFLTAQGVTLPESQVSGVMAPEDLTIFAGDMTVLVSCWN